MFRHDEPRKQIQPRCCAKSDAPKTTNGTPEEALRRLGAVLACVVLIGVGRRSWRAMFGMLALLPILACVAACGGGGTTQVCSATSTTAGAYTIEVTGTSGSTKATGTFDIIVQ